MSGFVVEVSFSESGEKCISLEVVLESGRNIRMEGKERFSVEGIRYSLDSPQRWESIIGERVIFIDMKPLIVDYREYPEKFGPELLDIFICCLSDVAEAIRKDPDEGKFVTTNGQLVEATPEPFLRYIEMAKEVPDQFLDRYNWAAQEGKTLVALDRNDVVIGGANVRGVDGDVGRVAYMSQLYIKPEFQGRKIGRELARRRENYALESLGLHIAEFDTLVYRPTIRFHIRRGYRFIRAYEDKYRYGTKEFIYPLIRMRKNLKG
jgi:GNAT superfamily N-acetyltransferase